MRLLPRRPRQVKSTEALIHRKEKLFLLCTKNKRPQEANMRKKSQQAQIVEYLVVNEWITPLIAFTELGITKLATRISELKRRGFLFDQKMIEVKNRRGETVRVMAYRLAELHVV